MSCLSSQKTTIKSYGFSNGIVFITEKTHFLTLASCNWIREQCPVSSILGQTFSRLSVTSTHVGLKMLMKAGMRFTGTYVLSEF